MTPSERRRVRRRAHGRCEYCQFPVRFDLLSAEINHIIAEQHGDKATPENVALSCAHCNSHKGPNIAGLDPKSGRVTRLFNPCVDRWSEHFRWVRARLVGLSAIGRTTIYVLAANDPLRMSVRQSLMEEERY